MTQNDQQAAVKEGEMLPLRLRLIKTIQGTRAFKNNDAAVAVVTLHHHSIGRTKEAIVHDAVPT